MADMLAPVNMTCIRCKSQIAKGMKIERFSAGGSTPRYAHVGCSMGRPPVPIPTPPPAPAIPVPRGGDSGPKGWVTEDKFSLPEDAIKRLRGLDAHDERADIAARGVDDDRVDDPDESKQSDGDGEDGGGFGEGDGDDDFGGTDGKGSDRAGEEGEADENGSDPGGEQPDGDGSGLDADDDGEEGEGEEDGEEGGDDEPGEEDGSGDDESQVSDQSGEEEDKAKKEGDKGKKDQKPKAEPKRNGKLEDLPDELLLKLVMMTAEMVTTKLKGSIEPRLAKLMAEAAEPLTAKMASEFQTKMGNSVRDQLNKAVSETRGETTKVVETLRKEVDRRVEAEIQRLDGLRPVVHKIERLDGSEMEFPKTEMFHNGFNEVLKLAGAGLDIFLPGPTGCGKTHLAEQVARALGVAFGIVSGTGGVTETELFGNSTPNIATGETNYQATEFVTLYENGGLFLLDEADAMDANCLLKVNSAIANGYCTIPKRLSNPRAKRHPNFLFVMAANTWGHGATRMYCGRNKLDEATLDRFRAGTVPLDYDPAIERRLVEDQQLYRVLAGWRAKMTEHGVQRVLSTRFMIQARKLKALGYDTAGIAKKLTGGWTPGETEKVVGRV